jgi:hypothetical protein
LVQAPKKESFKSAAFSHTRKGFDRWIGRIPPILVQILAQACTQASFFYAGKSVDATDKDFYGATILLTDGTLDPQRGTRERNGQTLRIQVAFKVSTFR